MEGISQMGESARFGIGNFSLRNIVSLYPNTKYCIDEDEAVTKNTVAKT